MDQDQLSGADLFEKQGAILLAQSGGCAVWQFRNETGDGTMTTYDVFPGAMLCFNDFHMDYYESSYVPEHRLLAIDHCREGRKEFSPGDDMLAYATLGGARATLNDKKVGSLTPGKDADITIINTMTPNNIPFNNAYGTVVYNSTTRDVEMVMIAGRIMKFQSKLVGVDLKALKKLTEESRDYLLAATGYQNSRFENFSIELNDRNYMGYGEGIH